MLPSLQGPTRKVSINAHRKKKGKRKSENLVQEKDRSRGTSSFLPLITEGSLNSLVGSKASESQWQERIIESRSMRPSKTRVRVINQFTAGY
jgi:hypothetical protein